MADAIKEDIDHEYMRNIICPWCGYKNTDSWETAWDLLEGDEGREAETECVECEKIFLFVVHRDIRYSTQRKHE